MNYSATFVSTPSSWLTFIFTADKLESEVLEILGREKKKERKRYFNQDLACLAGAATQTCGVSPASDSTIINFMNL